jgi:hypothetical protein
MLPPGAVPEGRTAWKNPQLALWRRDSVHDDSLESREDHMVKTLRLVLLGSLITTLAGCAGSARPSASAGPADVTGTWMGGTATGTTDMTLQLQQTGTKVTGTLAGVGIPDGPINGVVGGDTVQLSAERAAFAPRLVVRGDLMNGDLDGVPLNLVRLGRTQSSR